MKLHCILLLLIIISITKSFSQNQVDWSTKKTSGNKNISYASLAHDDNEITLSIDDIAPLQISFLDNEEQIVGVSLANYKLQFQVGNAAIFDFRYGVGDQMNVVFLNNKWVIKLNNEIIYTKIFESSALPSVLEVTSLSLASSPQIFTVR